MFYHLKLIYSKILQIPKQHGGRYFVRPRATQTMVDLMVFRRTRGMPDAENPCSTLDITDLRKVRVNKNWMCNIILDGLFHGNTVEFSSSLPYQHRGKRQKSRSIMFWLRSKIVRIRIYSLRHSKAITMRNYGTTQDLSKY